MATSSRRKPRATTNKAGVPSAQLSARKLSMEPSAIQLGEFLNFLYPGILGGTTPSWPPDVFALVMAVLQKSGAYGRVVTRWPPEGNRSSKGWIHYITE